MFQTPVFGFTDCFHTSGYVNPPWYGTSLATGTCSGAVDSSANHPGVFRFLSALNTANSGFVFWITTTAILISGLETSDLIFSLPELNANTLIRFGFQDVYTSSAVVDGVYIAIANDTLTGVTVNNSAQSVTATSFTLSASTWYHAKIVLNEDATLVTFYLYDEAGVLLWSDTLATNIPTARVTGHAIVCYNSAPGGTIRNLLDADYWDFVINRTLTR
jgi:hypothetical protein